MGILVIGLALGASFGLCFYMQIFFADMHPIIPFLLLGIGVDDMFVIVQVGGRITRILNRGLETERDPQLTLRLPLNYCHTNIFIYPHQIINYGRHQIVKSTYKWLS